MSVRYALSSTPYLREVRDIVLRIRKCFRFGQACRFTNLARSSREFGMNSSLSFHSQEQGHCWLPDPTATHVRKRFRPAGHTHATTQWGTSHHVTLDVPSSSAGATPGDAGAAIPATPLAPPAADPVVVANPVPGTGATAYPADLPPISSLSMLRSQPPFAWKLDLPGRKRATEEFVATTWEVEVETRDGQRELPLKMSFPSAITFPNPRGGWKEGETIIALSAYRLRGAHWRLDYYVKGRAGVPDRQLRRLAALAVTGMRGWGDRVEEHMSYP